MATLVVTANAAQVLRLCQTLRAVAAACADNKNLTFTLDDSDLSVTYTDGVYGSKTQKHK